MNPCIHEFKIKLLLVVYTTDVLKAKKTHIPSPVQVTLGCWYTYILAMLLSPLVCMNWVMIDVFDMLLHQLLLR